MKPRTEAEFYAYMNGEFQMTVQEASDFWYGVDSAVKKDQLDHATGAKYGSPDYHTIGKSTYYRDGTLESGPAFTLERK